MKTPLLIVFGLISVQSFAQNLPVSQTLQNRKAVIEEFTAYRCGNCPGGHQASREIAESQGVDNVLIISYHYGSLANPTGNDPDHRTSEGTSMGQFFGIQGTPSGPVNRRGNSSFSINNSTWVSNTTTVRNEVSDVNVALDVSIDANTRIATIDAEVFYTSNSPSTHYVTIGYVENEFVGPQASYNPSWNANYFNPDGSYRHQHIFRGYVNGASGTSVDANSSSVQSNNYSFTIPNDINGTPIDITQLQFFAIVHEGLNSASDSEILSAAIADPELQNLSIEEYESSISIYPNPSNGTFFVDGLDTITSIRIVNIQGQEIEFIQNNNEISIQEQTGLYFVVFEKNGQNFTKRLLIQ